MKILSFYVAGKPSPAMNDLRTPGNLFLSFLTEAKKGGGPKGLQAPCGVQGQHPGGWMVPGGLKLVHFE